MKSVISLKNIQKNRRLLIVYVMLIVFALILFLLWLSPINQTQKQNPLSPSAQQPTAPFSSFAPEVGWEKINLGIDKEEVAKYFRPIEESLSENGYVSVQYESNTPYSPHKIVYKDNKAIQIERFINERKEKITPEEFIKNFQRYEIIQIGVGNIRQVESYIINPESYIIIEYDAVYKQTYKIIYLKSDRYRIIRSNISAPHEFYSNDDAI